MPVDVAGDSGRDLGVGNHNDLADAVGLQPREGVADHWAVCDWKESLGDSVGGIVGERVESVSVACEDDSQEHGEWAVGSWARGRWARGG